MRANGHAPVLLALGKRLAVRDDAGESENLAEALADHGCRRLVGVGTNAEYDTSYGYLSERTPTAPTYLYSACKLGLSHSLAQLGLLTGMQVAWARLFYLYGPWEDPRRLVSSVTRSLLEGREAPCSEGLQVRDFLHVADVAGGLVAVLRSGVTGAVNVGSGEPVTVREVVTRLGAMIGRPELLRLGAIEPKAGEPAFVCADNTKLRTETGWRAAKPLWPVSPSLERSCLAAVMKAGR